MAAPAELHQVSQNLLIWQAFDPKVKAELFSSALVVSGQTWLVDPIPVPDDAFPQLVSRAPVAGIIITNANHVRASLEFAGRLSVPILAHHDSFPGTAPLSFKKVDNGTVIAEGLTVLTIEGAAPGEIALHHLANDGAMIVGDALINFEPYGFRFLPRKYCTNEKQMRRSLRKLSGLNSARLLFAHGTPILSRASERLEQLLEGVS